MKTNHPDGSGGISGYINTEVELKAAPSGLNYISILLGREKDQHGNNLPSYSITFFGQDAERLVSQAKKGDPIRVTKITLQAIQAEGKTYADSFALVGQDFEVISRPANPAPNRTDAEPPPAWRP